MYLVSSRVYRQVSPDAKRLHLQSAASRTICNAHRHVVPNQVAGVYIYIHQASYKCLKKKSGIGYIDVAINNESTEIAK